MNAKYLLDTNVLSELTRPSPSRKLLSRLARHRNAVCTAAPVWHELHLGVARLAPGPRRAALEAFVAGLARSDLPILPYDADAATWHGAERARLVAAGRSPPFVDGQIAAIAAVHVLVLVTSNRADFSGFRELELQDWRA